MTAPAYGDHPRCRSAVVRYTPAGVVSRLRLGPIVIDRVGEIERAYWAPIHFWAALGALLNVALLIAAAVGWGLIISERMMAAAL